MPTEAADMAMPKAGPQTAAPAPQAQARNWLQLNTPLTHWQGRRVWLVGASTGIGLACAQALRAAGAQVVVSAGAPAITTAPEPTIEVMVGNGGQVRMPASVSPDLASAIVRALVGR